MKNTKNKKIHHCKRKCKAEQAPHKFSEMTKYCGNCDDFLYVDNYKVRVCPCCGYMLRHYPKNAGLKRKFMAQMKIKYL